MSTNESNKECHLNNNDTLNNRLKIIDEALTKKNTHAPSSHGIAAKTNRDRVHNKAINALETLDVNSESYFNELLNDGDMH